MLCTLQKKCSVNSKDEPLNSLWKLVLVPLLFFDEILLHYFVWNFLIVRQIEVDNTVEDRSHITLLNPYTSIEFYKLVPFVSYEAVYFRTCLRKKGAFLSRLVL